ncbi:MAG: ComEC/Rec2 family competence protein [Coriobacteriia bacterium]|nr:ComEC/Rec2 family competence protein [Coriobacteriia bacterium]
MLGESVSWALHGDTSVWRPAAVATAVAGILGAAAKRWPVARGPVLLLLAGIVAGAGVSGMQGLAWHRQSETVADCGAREWVGSVEADPMPGRFGSTVRVRIRGGPLDGARVRVYWPPEEPAPDLGRMVRFSAVLKPVVTAEPWSRRVARSGAVALGTAWRAETGSWRPGVMGRLFAWRARILGRMHAVVGPGGDLLEGIVLGDRRRLMGTPADEDFRVLGLTHLVAVSGSHLALACSAVAVLGTMLGVRRRPLTVMTLVAGAAYAAVTGMAYAALRSLMMLGVAAVGEMSGRRGDGVASLATGVMAVLTLEPWSVYDIGFQLSVLAVGSLLLFGGLATVWAETGVPSWGRFVAGPVALTFVAQAVTVPVIAACFGMVSLLAPVANAYAGPLVSLALWTGLGGSVAAEPVPLVGEWLLRVSGAILEATARIARAMAATPGAAVSIGAGPAVTIGPVLAAAGVWLWWPVPRSRGIARIVVASAVGLSVAAAIGPGVARSATLLVLDVGQGDAILLRDGGRTMLVDAGPDDVTMKRALARHGIRRIDVLVFTHAHDDHTGGAAGLKQVVEIGWTGYPAVDRTHFGWVEPAAGSGAGYGDGRPLKTGDQWRLGGTLVTVLWPPAECDDELGTNDTSVILRIERGGFDALLGGDAERTALEGAASGPGLEAVEVLKVPHHGSDNGLTAEALGFLAPSDALISVGEGNDFGHPCASTLAMLSNAGCRTWRTDQAGDLLVRIGRSGYTITGSRRGTSVSVRARMNSPRRPLIAVVPFARPPSEAMHGSQGSRRPQAGLPHIRRGRTAARARPPPVAGAHRRGRRPYLQLRGVRWRVRGPR